MKNLLETIAKDISEATALRKEGDGLRKDASAAEEKGESLAADERRAEALKAYKEGIAQLQHAVKIASSARATLPAAPLPARSPEADLVSSLIEVHGAAGGLFQRLGQHEAALDSYKKGALLESDYQLPSTYNRLNAVKLELLNGIQTLAQITPRIDYLARHIQQSLGKDQTLGDGGWIYADLGDCLALLSKPDDAALAYASFIAKAGVKLPERALDVLKDVAKALHRSGDADVGRVDLAIETLTTRLTAA